MKYLLVLLLSLQAFAQTDLYLPWAVANDTFNSTIVVNNYGDEKAWVYLEATRANGDSESALWEIFPSDTSVLDSIFHFPSFLAYGPGYAVRIISESDHISASVIVQSKTTASGDSPSQINALRVEDASSRIVFNFVPTNTEGFAAPVTVNTSLEKATVVFKAMLGGEQVGQFQTELDPWRVFAMTTNDMFPDLVGDLYILAESDQPLVGTSFVFNDSREPSMAQAIPLKP